MRKIFIIVISLAAIIFAQNKIDTIDISETPGSWQLFCEQNNYGFKQCFTTVEEGIDKRVWFGGRNLLYMLEDSIISDYSLGLWPESQDSYLNNYWVQDIVVASGGNMIFALNFYNNDSLASAIRIYDGDQWISYDSTDLPLFKDVFIDDILIDNINSELWLSVYREKIDNGFDDFYSALVKYDGINWSVYDTSNTPLQGDFPFGKLYLEASGTILSNGLENYSFDGSNWINLQTPIYHHSTMLKDSHSNTWYSGNRGVIKSTILSFDTLGLNESSLFMDTGTWIKEIEEDKNGCVWFSKCNFLGIDESGQIPVPIYRSGVVRYDGQNYTTFTSDSTNEIFKDVVYEIEQASNGILWFATSLGFVAHNPDKAYDDGSVDNMINTVSKNYNMTLSVNNRTLIYTLANKGDVSIALYDVKGRVLLKRKIENLNAGKYSLDLAENEICPGVYIVKLVQNDKMFSKEFILR